VFFSGNVPVYVGSLPTFSNTSGTGITNATLAPYVNDTGTLVSRSATDYGTVLSLGNTGLVSANPLFGTYWFSNTQGTGSYNSVMGLGALSHGTVLSSNVAVGYNVLSQASQVISSVYMGSEVGALTTGNVFGVASVGYQNMYQCIGPQISASVGSMALYNGLQVVRTVAVGYKAGYTGATYNACTVVGSEAGGQGIGNVAVGYRAMQGSGTGCVNNVCVGAFAGLSPSLSYTGCIAIGSSAGTSLSNCYGNTILGTMAGRSTSSGQLNTILGYNANQSDGTLSQQIILGANVSAGSVTGGFYVPTGLLPVSSGTNLLFDPATGQIGPSVSSIRFKENISDIKEVPQLYNLRPVSFQFKDTKQSSYGLLAEEVNQVIPELSVVNAAGDPVAVRYDLLSVLLLIEWQKMKRNTSS
jgi:hypothetical protein